ncbi:MAG: hypothetical protein HYZ49_11235 [Chloroflexi bacterium]|nr:hypothetical protein [Chloroflexota bacterium]
MNCSLRLIDFLARILVAPNIFAHVAAGLALLNFGARASGYPIHPLGLMIYFAVVALSLPVLVIQFRYTPSSQSAFVSLLLASVPALASLVLRATLWMTPWLGGAPYAPYDPGDPDIVMFYSLFFALAFSAIAIVYGSVGYLLVAWAAQTALYFGTHAFPQWAGYSDANILGVRPSIFIGIVGIYAFSAALLFLRNWLFRQGKPNLWIASATVNLAGAWVFHDTLKWLPNNGAHLGYISNTTFVPEYAWDWSRPIAQSLALIAIIISISITAILWRPKTA